MNTQKYVQLLFENGISFYTGVPDSLLKHFCKCITDLFDNSHHIIAANEGAAIALATGYHLSTRKLPLVYLQNSGLGNSINPLVSLAAPEVYSIPILLLIGWRGEPGVKDEPQHIKQGRITLDLLKALEIPYEILEKDFVNSAKKTIQAINHSMESNSPFALVVKEDCFEAYFSDENEKSDLPLTREEALIAVMKFIQEDAIIVSTTGKLSRELFEFRETQHQGHQKDFLTVGSMGHSSQIALGIALQSKERTVFCFDGDGAVIMHMGSIAINGTQGTKNFKHILFNNGAHESVGGQKTAALEIDLCSVARACNYKFVESASSIEQIEKQVYNLISADGPGFLELKISKGSRNNLCRPTISPKQNKESLMSSLQK